ncbi:hypothetical protein HY992_01125 [Candidatus Micrarchaeota archaeon]|nr:hypothetical protein [Candidatus Micrarchaeota archaeon]
MNNKKNKLLESIELEMHKASEAQRAQEELQAKKEAEGNSSEQSPPSTGFISSLLARIPSFGNWNGGEAIQTEEARTSHPPELSSQAKNDFKKTQKKIARLENSLARETVCQAKLAVEQKEAERQVLELQSSLKSARDVSARAYEELHSKQAEADSFISQLEFEVNNPQLSTARAEFEEKKRELSELAKQLVQAKSKDKQSKALLASTQGRISEKKKSISTLEQSISSSGEKVALLGKTIYDLEETLRNGREQVQALEQKLSEKQQAIQALQHSKLELEKNFSEASVLLAQSEADEASLQTQARRLRSRLASRKRKLSACQQSLQSITEQLSSMEQRVPSTERVLSELLRQLHEFEQKTSEKQAVLSHLEENKKTLSEQVKEKRKASQSAANRVEELENETASLTRSIKRFDEKEKHLKAKAESLLQQQKSLGQLAVEAEKKSAHAERSLEPLAVEAEKKSLQQEREELADLPTKPKSIPQGAQQLEQLTQNISSDSFTREFINSCQFGERFTEKHSASLHSRGFKKTSSSNPLVRLLLSKLVGQHENLSFFMKPSRKSSSVEKEFAVWLSVMLLGKKHGAVKIHERGPHDVTFSEGKLAINLSKQENTVVLADSNSEKLLSREELDQLFD